MAASASRALRATLVSMLSASERLGQGFYLLLAALLGLVAVVAIVSGLAAGLQDKAYDVLVKNRVRVPVADPAVVILDIDEASLATMAGEYGRWPWPRQIMGEMVEGLAAQQPAAIVFDIAFSDPDVFNVESDRYFRDVAQRHERVYFPIIRLDAAADSLSHLRLAQLPGAVRGPDAIEQATMAAVVPFFMDVVKGARLGTNNLLTDEDGILRRYPVYRTEYGWRVNSLPAAVVAGVGGELPAQEEILLNWRGRPPSYQRVSFHEVYADLLRQKKQRPPDEFANKIVIIGSTAPALFDFKATSVARAHPGVEVLAAAIDNLRHGDYLRKLPPVVSILATLAALALLAATFVFQVDTRFVNLMFTIVQASFVAVSYLILNFSTLYVDLVVPFTFSLVYFTVARLNRLLLSYRRSGHPLFSDALDPGRRAHVIFLRCEVALRAPRARLRLVGEVRRQLARSRLIVVSPPLFKDIPLLHLFYKRTLLFYWLVPEERAAEAYADVNSALERVRRSLERARLGYLRRAERIAVLRLHAAVLEIDEGEAWHEQGESALAQFFAQGAKPPAGDDAVAIVASPAFRKLSAAEGVKPLGRATGGVRRRG